MKIRKVAVTGLGALTPLGNNVEDFWHGLANGVSGAAPISKFNTENFRTKFACEVKGFDALDFLDKKEARRMGAFTHFAIAASDEAVKHSGLVIDSSNDEMVGTYISSGIGDFWAIEREHEKPPEQRRDHWELILDASKEVGPALFWSLLVITVSFLPVCTLQATEGRLFKPLAYTKTFAIAASMILAITSGATTSNSRPPQTVQNFFGIMTAYSTPPAISALASIWRSTITGPPLRHPRRRARRRCRENRAKAPSQNRLPGPA